MKNYTYASVIKQHGGEELAWKEWSNDHLERSVYVDLFLSPALKAARCGWDGLLYKVIKYPCGTITSYMVLCVNGKPERWIPVDGNSDGCNLQVLGENIW